MFSAKDLQAVSSSSVFDDPDERKAKEAAKQAEAAAGEIGGEKGDEASEDQSAAANEKVEDENFEELPMDQLIRHNNWKARKVGYAQLEQSLKESSSNQLLSTYFDICVGESAAGATDGALDCALLMVKELYDGKDQGDLAQSATVALKKSLAGRPSNKQRAVEIMLELMQVDAKCLQRTLETLGEGCKDKSPKIQQACLSASRDAVKEFGALRLPVQTLVSVIASGLESKTPAVRKEATLLACEANAWYSGSFQNLVGNAIDNGATQKTLIKAMEEAEAARDKQVELKPTRRFRGQSEKDDAAVAPGKGGVDLFDVLPENSILDKLDSSVGFEKRIKEPKWQERKNVIEQVIGLCGNPPKLCKGEYTGLTRQLKAIVQSDANQAVVVAAIQLITAMAAGLRAEYTANARTCVGLMLLQYRNKKTPLIAATDACLDTIATYCINITEDRTVATIEENYSQDGSAGKQKSTPLQRTHICMWLERCLLGGWAEKGLDTHGFQQIIKLLAEGCMDAESKVRELSSQTLQKLKDKEDSQLPQPCIAFLEEQIDALQKKNPKLFAKQAAQPAIQAPPPIVKEAEVASKKPAATEKAKPVAAATLPKEHEESAQNEEPLLTAEEAHEILQSMSIQGFAEALAAFEQAEKWQDKVLIYECVEKHCEQASALDATQAQAVVVFLSEKSKAFSEANFNIMNSCWRCAQKAVDKCPGLARSYTSALLSGGEKRLGDKKQGPVVQSLILSLAEASGPQYVAGKLVALCDKLTAPGALQDALQSIEGLASEFGAPQTLSKANLKTAIELCATKGLGAKGPAGIALKKQATALLVELYRQIGAPVQQLLPEAAAKQLEGELAQVQVQGTSAQPKRAAKGSSEEQQPQVSLSMGDLMPRADVSSLLTPQLLEQMADESSKAAWKVRMKAIDDVADVVAGARGHVLLSREVKLCMTELRKRLQDSNSNLVTKALASMGLLGNSVGGDGAATLARANGGAVFRQLGDIKKSVVVAAEKTLEQWTVHENGHVHRGAYLALLQQLPDALSDPKSKMDRKCALLWLSKYFPFAPQQGSSTSSKQELEDTRTAITEMAKPLVVSLQARDPTERKLAIQCISLFVRFLGLEEGEQLFQASCRDLKPAVARGVLPLLKQAYEEAGGEPVAPAAAAPAPADTHKQSEAPVKKAATLRPNQFKEAKQNLQPPSPSKKEESEPASACAAEAPAGDGPVFLHVSNTLREKREEKGIRNRWPTMFDEKDKRRMQEYWQSLKDDMEKVVSRDLLQLMFKDSDSGRAARGSALDPAFQILQEELPNYGHEAMEAFDLLLKWATLQLMNNNTQVTGNILQLLDVMFELASYSAYKMTDYEAAAFLPHLLNKLGEKQKRFRDSVRGIMKQVTQVFPYSKYLPYVFAEASPNQRSILVLSECLDELARLTREHGKEVLRVKLGVGQNILKTVVGLVGDQRKEVRSAALAVIQALWEHCERDNEQLFKVFSQCKVESKDRNDKVTVLIVKHLKETSSNHPEPLSAASDKAAEPAEPAPKSNTLRLKPEVPQPSSPGTPSDVRRTASRLAAPSTAVTPSTTKASFGFNLDLPSTPPSPSERKRANRLGTPNTAGGDASPHAEKENDPVSVSRAMYHASEENQTPGKAQLWTSKPAWSRTIADIDADIRAYLDLLRADHGREEEVSGAKVVRDSGIKALALLGSKDPPPGWTDQGKGQQEWIALLAAHCDLVETLTACVELVAEVTDSPFSPPLTAASDLSVPRSECRLLKLTLPALLTLAWWPELRQAVADKDLAAVSRWVTLMCDLVARLMQQRTEQLTASEGILDSDEIHELHLERERLLKTAQTVLAKLSETPAWLPAVLNRVRRTNEVLRGAARKGPQVAPVEIERSELRLKRVLRSSLREYAALQQSLVEPFHSMAFKESAKALEDLLTVGIIDSDPDADEDRACLEQLVEAIMGATGKKFTSVMDSTHSLSVFAAKILVQQKQRVEREVLSEEDKLKLGIIFQNISLAIKKENKALRDEAMNALFRFEDSHPYFNAEEHLQGSSNWFRSYILDELLKRRTGVASVAAAASVGKYSTWDASSTITASTPETESVYGGPAPESAATVNVNSIRERIGKLRKDYVKPILSDGLANDSHNREMIDTSAAKETAKPAGSGLTTLESIRERMAARRKAALS